MKLYSRILALRIYACFGLNIIVHSSFGGRSHIKGMLEVSEVLTSRGHQVTYAALEYRLVYANGYNISTWSLGPSNISKDELKSIFQAEKGTENYDAKLQSLRKLEYIVPREYYAIHDPLKKLLLDTKPDLVICDFFTQACNDISKAMGIPLVIGLQTLDSNIVPRPKFMISSAEFGSLTTESLTLWKRLNYVVIRPVKNLWAMYPLVTLINSLRQEHSIPTSFEFTGYYGYGLVLANSFLGFEVAYSLPANIQLVGPILSPNRNNFIPQTIQNLLDQSKKVMYIGFGSHATLNENDVNRLATAANQALNEGLVDGVIWGLGATSRDIFDIIYIHPKILLQDWAPQQQILEHNNTKIFISHGGLESTVESLIGGTPILCIPYVGDQAQNAAKIERMGVGRYMNRFTATPQDLVASIRNLTSESNNLLKANLQRIKIIALNSSKRIEIAADLIESHAQLAQVCRPYNPYFGHGTPCELEHLISPASRISWIHQQQIDVYLLAAFLLFMPIHLIYILIKFLKKSFQGKRKDINLKIQ